MNNVNQKIKLTNELVARNRTFMAPMDTLMAEEGFANDFHIQHYGARAFGGVGTIIVESTAVSSEGRIRPKDLGFWKEEHVAPMAKIAKIAKEAGAIIGVQLNHAGAKAETSEVKYAPGYKYWDYLPQDKTKLMTEEDFTRIENQFVDAAKRAKAAGFDFVEVHGAHGYLLNEIMHKLINEVNTSEDILVRAKIVLNIVKRIHDEVKIPVGIRMSVVDHEQEGMHVTDYAPLIKELDKYVIYFNVSSGETISKVRMADVITEVGKLFRLPLAVEVKSLVSKPVIVAGNISSLEDVQNILSQGIDGVVIGRELLFNPNFVVTTLLDVEQMSKEDYHWNNNIWYNHVDYLKTMKMLKLK